ncbi:fimbrial protein, partial [Salmonella enterica]|nr:fimbrial protein [Salmonella enterica]
MKKIALLICLLFVEEGHAAVQRTIFRADVVASACHVSVNADGAGGSRLTFGAYRKSTAAPVPPRDFTVHLYETGATVQGCSAFKAGRIATLDFGNPGQLDGAGVVTRGAGDGIRVDVRA